MVENPFEGSEESERITVQSIPLFIVVLHRLARLLKADKYAGFQNRFVLFKFDNEERWKLAEKWVGLHEVDQVTIIYDPTIRRKLWL